MVKTTTIKTTFSAGEVSPDVLGRGDLRAYENGALTLRNVFIQPTGGVTRRAGLRHIATAAGVGRLVAFEFSTTQTYLLALTHEKITVYDGSTVEVELTAPYAAADIAQVAWTQSADTLLLVHPDYPPKKLTRSGAGVWALSNWVFYTATNRVRQPMYKFADVAVTLTPSATTGTITITASAAVFDAAHNGTRLRLGNKEVLITAVSSSTVITAVVQEALLSTSATIDWEEQAFSPVRGYPATVVFHQDRLVIGGSRDLPNRIWMSQSGDLFNFDLGTGLDSEAIEFGIFSDQINAIRGVFSGRHLQVFTSGAEWMVTGDPLTPSTVQIRRQTRVGSRVDRYIPPLDVDGATLFVARNGQELREFIYTDVEQAYQSTDLALLSHHIITTPVDQDFDQKRRLLFLVRDDGKFATLTVYRAEAVTAWTLHETAGQVLSVAVVGDNVYLMVTRGSDTVIELVDDAVALDAALRGESGSPTTTWSGLTHLNGDTVTLIGDGRVLGTALVSSGVVTSPAAVMTLEAGLPFTHIIEPLPISNVTAGGMATALRPVNITLRLQHTAALQMDMSRGLTAMSLRQLGQEDVLDAPVTPVSGDMQLRAYGWRSDMSKPLWRIEQSLPLPFTLLAVAMTVMANE